MFLTPEQIAQRPDIVESTERATLRMVAHAIFLYETRRGRSLCAKETFQAILPRTSRREVPCEGVAAAPQEQGALARAGGSCRRL